ncbi:hypothetical protein [Actinocorallia libanotica]|uniref:Uncharacterized protein n=1 Tax=Actinocorallia libanotica TaxID=46162 RepID=A0ABP4AGA3_9ACTN
MLPLQREQNGYRVMMQRYRYTPTSTYRPPLGAKVVEITAPTAREADERMIRGERDWLQSWTDNDGLPREWSISRGGKVIASGKTTPRED